MGTEKFGKLNYKSENNENITLSKTGGKSVHNNLKIECFNLGSQLGTFSI